jgi:uncharacterized membrane protein
VVRKDDTYTPNFVNDMALITVVKDNILGQKSAWAATFATFLLWGVTLLVTALLGGNLIKRRAASDGADVTPPAAAVAPKSKFDAERMAERLFLGLFASVLVNDLWYGVRRSVGVIAWIVFALSALYLLVRGVLHHQGRPQGVVHKAVTALFLVPIFILWITMWSIAWDNRW